MKIRTAARSSPLSKAQVKEVELAIQKVNPQISFESTFVKTYGDIDQKTSLRALDKTDFFTREVDDLILKGHCDIAIHSAKDLPDPINSNLKIIALTQSLDERDALVLKEGLTLQTLPPNAKIATSSVRREEAVKQLRNDFIFIDLRGTILERIHKLNTGEAEGVVIAEAALIRLNLNHLNRILLPGPTTPLQGQLAILCHKNNVELEKLFCNLDVRS